MPELTQNLKIIQVIFRPGSEWLVCWTYKAAFRTRPQDQRNSGSVCQVPALLWRSNSGSVWLSELL